jgi:hypothetical protein
MMGGTFTLIGDQWASDALSGLFEVDDTGAVRHQFEGSQLCEELPLEFEGRDIDEFVALFESLDYRPLSRTEPTDAVRRRFLSSACQTIAE